MKFLIPALTLLLIGGTVCGTANGASRQSTHKSRAMCTIIKASHRLDEPDVDRPAMICCRDERAVRRCRKMPGYRAGSAQTSDTVRIRVPRQSVANVRRGSDRR
jgi:hypothetical protein